MRLPRPPWTAPCAAQVADDVRLHVELPVGEMLDQHGLQQGLVRRRDGDQGQRPQARAQVGQGDSSSPGGAREVSSIDSLRSRARFSR